jgi:hypothetical protein
LDAWIRYFLLHLLPLESGLIAFPGVACEAIFFYVRKLCVGVPQLVKAEWCKFMQQTLVSWAFARLLTYWSKPAFAGKDRAITQMRNKN